MPRPVCARCNGAMLLEPHLDGPSEWQCLACGRGLTPPVPASDDMERSAASRADGWLEATLTNRERARLAGGFEVAEEIIERTFRVPLPVRGLSPNGDRRVWVQRSARKEYREECAAALLEQLGGRRGDPFPFAVVGVAALVCRQRMPSGHTMTPALLRAQDRYRPHDEPNLVYALKPLFDALQDVGVLWGDDADSMELGHSRIVRVEQWEDEGVDVEIAGRLGPPRSGRPAASRRGG